MAKITSFGASIVSKSQKGGVTFILTTDGRILKSICGDKPTVITRGISQDQGVKVLLQLAQ